MLIAAGHSVKIIEMKEEKAQMLAENLRKAAVICGDGAQQELLLEEGLDSMDAFVALTESTRKTFCFPILRRARRFKRSLPRSTGMNSPHCRGPGNRKRHFPKDIVSDIVVRYVRALNNTVGSSMDTLYKVMDGRAEAARIFGQRRV